MVEPEMKRMYPSYDVQKFYTKEQVETVMERMFARDKADINIIDPEAFGICAPRHAHDSDVLRNKAFERNMGADNTQKDNSDNA